MNSGFPTTLLDSAIARKIKTQEELRLKVIKKVFAVLDKLALKIHFDDAYIFGSAAKPFRFYEGSDLDIGFVGLEDKYFFKAMSFISQEAGLETDIIQLEGHRLAEKIKREGIRWKKRD